MAAPTSNVVTLPTSLDDEPIVMSSAEIQRLAAAVWAAGYEKGQADAAPPSATERVHLTVVHAVPESATS